MPPRPRTPRDPNHPDYPHGTRRGYDLGCHSPECCGPAERRYRKQMELNKLRGVTPAGPASPELVEKARRKARRMMQSGPTVSQDAVAESIGIPRSTLSRVLEGRPISAKTVRKVMAAKAVTAPAGFVPAADFLLEVGKLRALGYPARWQQEQTGAAVLSAMWLAKSGRKERVRRTLYTAIVDLAQQVDGAPATPESVNARPGDIQQTINRARRDGYYPPSYYDADGNLDPALIPDHPVAIANDKADDALAEAHRMLRALDGRGVHLAAEWLVPDDAEHRDLKLSNMRTAILRFHRENRTGADTPGGFERRKHMRTVIEDYNGGAYGSPVAVALALGLWTLDHSHVYGLLLPARPGDKNKAKSKHRPAEPHPGVAEAAELGHLNPLVAVPLEDTDEAAA